MPQLMPFYWMNSVLMIFVILFSMMFLYNFKDLEKIKLFNKKYFLLNNNLLW